MATANFKKTPKQSRQSDQSTLPEILSAIKNLNKTIIVALALLVSIPVVGIIIHSSIVTWQKKEEARKHMEAERKSHDVLFNYMNNAMKKAQ